MVVLDASVVVDWVTPSADESRPSRVLFARLAATEQPLHAPRLLVAEVGNALLTGVRAGRWRAEQADVAWLLLRDIPVRLDDRPADLDRAWELARRFDEHPIYDLLYVAMAERLGARLVTADERLRRRLVGLDRVVSPEQALADPS